MKMDWNWKDAVKKMSREDLAKYIEQTPKTESSPQLSEFSLFGIAGLLREGFGVFLQKDAMPKDKKTANEKIQLAIQELPKLRYQEFSDRLRAVWTSGREFQTDPLQPEKTPHQKNKSTGFGNPVLTPL